MSTKSMGNGSPRLSPVYGFVGYAMCFSWFCSFFYFTRSPFFSFTLEGEASWMLRAGGAAVFVILFSLSGTLADVFSTQSHLRVLWFVSGVLAAIGYLMPLAIGRTLALAASYVCLMLLWDVYLATQPKVVGFAGGAVVGCGVLALIIRFLDPWAADMLLALLPFGSLALLAVVAQSALAERRFVTKADSSIKPYQSFEDVFSLLSTGFLLGLAASCISSPSASFPLMGYTGAALTWMFAGLLLIFDGLRTKYYSQSVLLKFSLLGVVPSLLVIPFLPSDWLSVGGWLMLFIMLRHGTFAIGDVAEKVRTLRLSDFGSFSTVRMCNFLGFLAGWIVTSSIFQFADSFFSRALLCFSALYVLVISVVLQTRKQPATEANVPHSGIFRRKVSEVAKQHQLTPRQEEVLFLLGKGRNADYIQKEFYISHTTAKTHIYTIYKKLNVHSQQELMNLIDAARVD